MIRAGRLDRRVTVKRIIGDPPTAQTVTTVWSEQKIAKDGDASGAGGLRSPAPVQYRMRYGSLLAGWYLVDSSRLFVVDHVRNWDGKRGEWLASCTELVGDPATYTPAAGAAVSTRCFVLHDAPYASPYSQSTEYRTLLELPIIEVGRAKKGDAVTVRSVAYTLLGLADGGDDGVVRRIWAAPT